MDVDPFPAHASDALAPGARCRITEDEWFHFLQVREPLHQWAGAFLHAEDAAPGGRPAAGAGSGAGLSRATGGGLVRVYLRDDSPRHAHVCVRLDAARSARARAGVAEIEAFSRAAADVITAHQAEASLTPDDLAAEQAASSRLTAAVDALYAELLAPPRAG